jgi:hypothetical protein
MRPISSATALAIAQIEEAWHLHPHCGAEHSITGSSKWYSITTLQCSLYVAAPSIASPRGPPTSTLGVGPPGPVRPGFRPASHLLKTPGNATGVNRATLRVGLPPTGRMMLRAALNPWSFCLLPPSPSGSLFFSSRAVVRGSGGEPFTRGPSLVLERLLNQAVVKCCRVGYLCAAV